jgi:D-glycero-D-manno-heptose 1,7-bisphosphate phosphatase
MPCHVKQVMIRKAVFLDRDGTFIVNKHYLKTVDQIEYYPDSFDFLAAAQEKGYFCFLVTNQSGVSRGMFTENDVMKVHNQIQQDCITENVDPFDDIIYCPHQPSDNCECRKPKPKMVLELMKKHKLLPENCVLIGDNPTDIECGKNAGIEKSYLIAEEEIEGTISGLLEAIDLLP